LEEPPTHCIFILATTEKHKIIPTILSRCQIYDFKRITVSDTKNYLKLIAKEQGVKADEDALNIIAQKSDGAMRDALSIFDRVVSFCGENLTRKAVSENLSVLDFETYFESTNLIIENDIPALFLMYNNIINKGFEGQHYINGLASHFRDLFVSKNIETIDLLDYSSKVKDEYKTQSKKTSAEFLTEAISLTNDCDLKFRNSKNKRLLVEICLMKLASINFDGEKKKTNKFIIPASNFKSESSLAQNILKNEEPIDVENQTLLKNTPKIDESIGLIAENINIDKGKTLNTPTLKRQSSGLSLKSIQRKKDHKIKQMEVAVKPEDLPKNTFKHEELLICWDNYVKKIEEQGRHNLAAILKIDEPKLKENYIIGIEFPNSTNKIEVEREKTELLKYLRISLDNYTIDLDITVNEIIEKKFVYTNEEKFQKLKEKNPSLEALKKSFNLEL